MKESACTPPKTPSPYAPGPGASLVLQGFQQTLGELAFIAHQWVQETGAKSYQPTPRT